VDIGVHQDGLIHISQLADRFVRDPAEVVHVRQKVRVTVLSVDPARNRIALSLKAQRGATPSAAGKSEDRPVREARPQSPQAPKGTIAPNGMRFR
jgi:uncharacterized protein